MSDARWQTALEHAYERLGAVIAHRRRIVDGELPGLSHVESAKKIRDLAAALYRESRAAASMGEP